MKQLQALFVTAIAVGFAALAGRGLLFSWLRKDAVRAYENAMVEERLQRAANWTATTAVLQQIAVAAAAVVVVVVALFGLVAAVAFAVRQRNLARMIPVGKDGLPAPMQYRLPDGTIAVLAPAMLPGAGALIGRAGVALLSDPDAAERHRVNATVARTAAARGDGGFRIPNQATGRFLTGALDPRPLPPPPPQITVLDPQPPAPPPRLLSVRTALESSDPDRWIVGQNRDTGALAVFNRRQHFHAGIVGATGTGKTTSLGFTLVAEAIATGCQVIILDPEGGYNWGHFAPVAEHHPTDVHDFPGQLAAVFVEFQRRFANPEADHRPLLLVIEEYGDLIRSLRQADRTTAQKVDEHMEALLRRGRKVGISLVLIDQYPEHWSQQVIANIRRLFVFKLGPGQGNKVGVYKAQDLPDQAGVFLIPNEGQFRGFDTTNHLPLLLRTLPALPAPRLIEGEFRRIEDRSLEPFSAPFTERPTERPLNGGLNGSTSGLNGTERSLNAERAPGTPPLPPLPVHLRSAPKREFVFGVLDHLRAHGWEPSQANVRAVAEQVGYAISRGWIAAAHSDWTEASRG